MGIRQKTTISYSMTQMDSTITIDNKLKVAAKVKALTA
jgi:hypothetical protein